MSVGKALSSALFGLLLAAAPGTRAQAPGADPTRPPDAVPAQALDGGAADNQLQSVMIPKSGRARALIGGRWVVVGEKIGESTLVRVRPDGVDLKGPGGVEKLALTPLVEKKAAPAAKVATSTRGKQKKEAP
ncbi:MAG: hypothetical protein JNM82_14610 [Rhodocyclaceae bacterium]|nr:hypothetical protein [Rhodocyclaceae bacterium]